VQIYAPSLLKCKLLSLPLVTPWSAPLATAGMQGRWRARPTDGGGRPLRRRGLPAAEAEAEPCARSWEAGPAHGREAGPARMEAGRHARRPSRGGGRAALVAEVDLPLRIGTAVGVVYKICFFLLLFT